MNQLKVNNPAVQSLIDYALFWADSTLIIGQRNSEWCGHGPVLEQDIAITNITLDLIGQARNFYQLAASIYNANGHEQITEDGLAYHRDERAYSNLLITELPKGDWAQTILRQYFFSVFQQLCFEKLSTHQHADLSAIAVKSLKETRYHVKWSAEWVIRLGDGTEESHNRMLQAIDSLWMYTGEMFTNELNDLTDHKALQESWIKQVNAVLEEATLPIPAACFMQTGGRKGIHTEHLGYILSEMQYLQKTHPGAAW
jgi:ring-1,2-phenylacetyl-CoA epoxidase subunit PaaC